MRHELFRRGRGHRQVKADGRWSQHLGSGRFGAVGSVDMKCGDHAKMMAALVPVERMGTNAKALYERLTSQAEEECIAEESQVVGLVMEAITLDNETADESWGRALDFGRGV